jgi:hypothetical protein
MSQKNVTKALHPVFPAFYLPFVIQKPLLCRIAVVLLPVLDSAPAAVEGNPSDRLHGMAASLESGYPVNFVLVQERDSSTAGTMRQTPFRVSTRISG